MINSKPAAHSHKINKNGTYRELREKYPDFIYSGYEISKSDKSLDISYTFEIPGLARFCPEWHISILQDCCPYTDDVQLKTLVFSLGMVELMSYWKTACPPNVRICCASLTKQQQDWWKKLYFKGLGEFFYINAITADESFINITAAEAVQKNEITQGGEDGKPVNIPSTETSDSYTMQTGSDKVLIPIGGGKDSAVTLELLKGHADRYCYIINPRKATLDTVSAGSIDEKHLIIAKRSLDSNMLELNKKGFLNGHTPFSAIVAFSSVIAAYMHKIGYVALSNESSADEPTVTGSDVNHQYSKSLEFETDFTDYEARNISTGVKYFSLLRPLTEAGIAKIFSRLNQYHSVFRSCNAGSKEDIWCAACPKCLFTYIILAPFLPDDTMIKIFGKNMLSSPEMIPLLEKLIGIKPEKPFECVGSREEVNAAMQFLTEKYESAGLPLPALAAHYKNAAIKERYDFHSLCGSYNENNLVPEKFVRVIKNELNKTDD